MLNTSRTSNNSRTYNSPLFTITATSQATSMARESKVKRKATDLRNPQEEDGLKKRKKPRIPPTHRFNSTWRNPHRTHPPRPPTKGRKREFWSIAHRPFMRMKERCSHFLYPTLFHGCATNNGEQGLRQEASHFVVISPIHESHTKRSIRSRKSKEKGVTVVKRKKD